MKRPRPPRLDGESKDDYYMRLIQELANEKLALYIRYNREQEEEECKEITNLSSHKSKGALKRKRVLIEEDDSDDIEIKIKRQKKKAGAAKVERRAVVVNEVTERSKEFIKNEINGSEIKLVIQKTLFASDLNHGQNRLNMPAKQLATDDFLTADEKRILKENKNNRNRSAGVEVGMLGPDLRMYDQMLELKIWDMPCTYNYVLINNWFNFVKEHHTVLKEGTLIQVWSFRVNQQLCLAVVCPDDDVANVEKLDGGNDNMDVVVAANEV